MKPTGIEKIKNNFIEKFGDTIDFSEADYKNNYTKIKVKCKKCNTYIDVFPKEILRRGILCPECLRKEKEKSFIEEAKKLYGNLYDYSKVHFELAKKPVKIICKEHGIFEQTPEVHLNGHKCPYCNGGKSYDLEYFIKKANIKHNNFYNYDKVDYKTSIDKVIITCPKHGDFLQRPDYHLRGGGCPVCNITVAMTTEIFIKKLKDIFEKNNIFYDYNKTIYKSTHEYVIATCPKHGDFRKKAYQFLQGQGCPHCAKAGKSNIELEIYNFILDTYKNIEIIKNTRNNLFYNGKNSCYEIDLFFPKFNIGIEVNGEYWHKKREQENPGHHKFKNKLFKENNIKILNLPYREWIYKNEFAKQRIIKFLNLNTNQNE